MTEKIGKTGSEFRNDNRRTRALPPAIIKELTRLNPYKSTLAIFETVGVLAICVSLSLYFWNIWVILPAILIIATRQQACFILAHDAAHYRLFERRWLNDLIGRSVASPVGISMCSYRVLHRLHHNHLYGKQDPDIPLHGGYPRGTLYLIKKLLKDLLGGTALKTFAYFFGKQSVDTKNADGTVQSHSPLDDTSPALKHAADRDRWTIVIFHLAAPALAFYTGYLEEYLILWILPLFTFLQPILRFRAICEHGAVPSTSSPLKASRTNVGPFWIRFLIFPHNVNYHIEHHLYPAIPHYNLPKCHAELQKRGLLEDAVVRDIRATTKLVAGLGQA
ncbi:MAG: fatty acid desaturase family protein [Sneathiella sp.]|nr:fatty acid desaturase family protein [Sneathiella sp.]